MGKKYLLFVHTKPVEGREAEYDEWYEHTHLRDVVGLEGFDAAQRWKFSHPHPADAAAPPYRNLAIYEVDEANYEKARASLAASVIERGEAVAAGRQPQVPVSPALDDDRVAYWFVEASERVESEG